MRRFSYARVLPAVCFCIVLMLSLSSCEEDVGIRTPLPVGPVGGGYDPVFSADGGFIITYAMLDERYNKITFPGTHNSHTSGDAWADYCTWGTKNQDLTVTQQLRSGIRFIEFDINCLMNLCHNKFHTTLTLYDQFVAVRAFAEAHPNQVITVRISDVVRCNPDYGCDCSAHDIYTDVNSRLEWTGLAHYIYNFDRTQGVNSPGKAYIPDPWPTLRQMIDSGKNVMFFHSRETGEFSIIDEDYYRSLDYSNSNLYEFYQATQMEYLCNLVSTWAPPQSRQRDTAYRLFLVECCPDQCDAGDRRTASKNNDGRKLYQLAKHAERELLPDNRSVNFILVDYYRSGWSGPLPIDVVDACNRLNYERVGGKWVGSEGFWELYPYEFDNTRIEHITRIPSITNEVEKVIDDFNNKLNLDGHEREGKIVSTSYRPGPLDWKKLPEWAVDEDFTTRWCGSDISPNHTWGIDLGEPRAIDEIAIAWEYPHHRPGYKVFASNDDGRFADGISQAELADDSGWTLVAEGARVDGGEVLLWDQKVFTNTETSNWRYIKVKVTDAGADEWPTFYELRLYGPAN